MRDFSKARKAIEIFDEKILEILALRMDEVEVVGKYKIENNLPVKDHIREKDLLSRLEKKASDLGLEKEMVRDVFSSIIRHSCKKQEQL